MLFCSNGRCAAFLVPVGLALMAGSAVHARSVVLAPGSAVGPLANFDGIDAQFSGLGNWHAAKAGGTAGIGMLGICGPLVGNRTLTFSGVPTVRGSEG